MSNTENQTPATEAEAAEKTITIQGLEFTVSQPYAEGHTITLAEARALNQVRAENIRNNQASVVRAAQTEGEPDENGKKTFSISDEAYVEVSHAVAEYDREYVFSLASVGGGRKSSDPVEVEAKRIAKAAITAKLKADGRLVKDVDKDALAAAVAKLADSPKVIAAATKAVKERNAAAQADLGDLGL